MRSTTPSGVPEPPRARRASRRGPKYRTNRAPSGFLACFAATFMVLSVVLLLIAIVPSMGLVFATTITMPYTSASLVIRMRCPMKSCRIFVVACMLVVSASLPAQAPPADIAPGDNLVTDGIPSIPAAIAATTNRYTEFRTASLQDWHPTERSVLITTRFGDTNQVHQVKFPNGARTQLTFFPDRVAGANYQPTKGDHFLLLKDVGGSEWFQIYRYDFPTG